MIAAVSDRIKATHDAHGCRTWETWSAPSRDALTGKAVECDWIGCRSCGVAILVQEATS